MSSALLTLLFCALLQTPTGSGGPATAGAPTAGAPAGSLSPAQPPQDEQWAVPEPAVTREVARIEVVLPVAESFLLRATVPVPPQTHGYFSAYRTIGIAGPDGEPVPTQIEIVSRYPGEFQGAAVIEVLATVSAPEDAAPGDRVHYSLLDLGAPSPLVPLVGEPLDQLRTGPADLGADLNALLASPNGINLQASDVLGNLYRMRVLEGTWPTRVHRTGDQTVEIQISGVMEPAGPGAGQPGTTELPHFFGVHAFLRTQAGSPVLGLDLRLFNGFADLEPGELDKNVNHLLFDELELELPAGFSAFQAFGAGGAGEPVLGSSSNVLPLVLPEADGATHLFPQGAQTHRRFAIAPIADFALAKAHVARTGLGFVVPGVSPEDGATLWHWSNLETARYFPQAFQMPSVEHLGLDAVRTELRSEFNALFEALDSGVGFGELPVLSDRLGWAHPYGAPYGGVTGGIGIHLFDGIATLGSASLEGYRTFEMLHRMQGDRQPSCLYRANGEPVRVGDLLKDTPFEYVPLQFYGSFLGGVDTLGLKNLSTEQFDAAAALGRLPSYADAILGYDAYDIQHLIRYTRCLKVLVWLGNDALAKTDLGMQAEIARLSYHPYPNKASGGFDETGMLRDINDVALGPGSAFDFGRGEGWIADTMAAYYAVAEPQWRAGAQPWFETLAQLVSDGQAPCSGSIMGVLSTKFLDATSRCGQAYSVSIVGNALRGVHASVLQERSPELAADLRTVLERHYVGFISDFAWSADPPGPKQVYAVAPPVIGSRPYCGIEELPKLNTTGQVNSYQTMSTLGFGFDWLDDPEFLDRAEELLGGSLLPMLEAAGLENIENRAALLAVAQRLAGVL